MATGVSSPRYSVCQFTTIDLSFEQDLEFFARTGATGIGIWEGKLRDGDEEPQEAALRASGLDASICIPNNIGPLPVPDFPGPSDIDERIEAMCGSIRRLARFGPAAVVVVTGADDALSPAEQRRIAVEGLREAARTAAEVGTRLSIEPIREYPDKDYTFVRTIPDTLELIAEIGDPSVGIQYDVYHLFDTDDVVALTERHAESVAGVHVNDYRRGGPRVSSDRVLPGDGVIDLPALFAALEAGGFSGWYDLEIFSEPELPDSLWTAPAEEVLRRGRAGFLRAWEQAEASLARR
jgi:sugar phosphate isomerase/epimerase